jgi:hypothetical protein
MNNSLQLSTIEAKMFNEVFDIFSKYSGQTRAFGIQLDHSHFPLKKGEVLYETHNKINRVLTIRPRSAQKISKKTLATAWNKGYNKQIQITAFCCDGVVDSPVKKAVDHLL